MNILICGISGKMGRSIYEAIKGKFGIKNIIGFDKKTNDLDINTYNDLDYCLNNYLLNLVIDFSHYDISKEIIEKSFSKKINVISGTTGYSIKEIDDFNLLANNNNVIFYWSPNFSLGYKNLVKVIESLKNDYLTHEIIETHNTTKKDIPSGTSKVLASILDIEQEKIQSVRLCDSIAKHEIIFTNKAEKITVIHEISDRKGFLDGFIKELEFLIQEVGE